MIQKLNVPGHSYSLSMGYGLLARRSFVPDVSCGQNSGESGGMFWRCTDPDKSEELVLIGVFLTLRVQ